MKIELLYFEGCPSFGKADEYIREITEEEGLDRDYEMINVQTDKKGYTLKFLGSPTILVNGKDIEEGVPEAESFRLKCRVYQIDGRLMSCPPKEFIRTAILKPHIAP